MNASKRGTRVVLVVLLLAVALVYGVDARQGKAMNTPLSAIKWQPYAPGNPLQVGILWGDRTKPVEYAMYLKMPAGFEAGRHSHTNDYHGVAVQGTWVHTNDGGKPQELSPGGYVFQPGKQVHNDSCKGTSECIILIHQMGPGDFIPAK
jgi:quercetin dioxygenase-like cupin family protein